MAPFFTGENMASVTDICNLALNEIGEIQIIDIAEESKPGRLCRLVYADTRDEVLRSHPWNFAIKRSSLAQLTTAPEFEFTYQYQLPTDCLRVIKTDDDLSGYRIEGRKLLSDNGTIAIEYISRVEDTTQFDSLFIEVLAVRIAARLAYNLSDNNTLTQLLEQKYRDRMRHAKSMDGQEGTPRSVDADQWLNSRV